MAGIFLGRPPVGMLGPGDVAAIEIEVPKPEEELCLVLPVTEGAHKEINALLAPSIATEILGLGEELPHEVGPRGRAQGARVGERSSSLPFSVLMSSHVWYFGLPLSLLAFRRR